MRARVAHGPVGLHWYALATAALPLLVLTILYALGALVSPVYAPTLALMGLAGLFAGYLEEIGWTGYATPRLRARWSPVTAGMWLGVLWGSWHALADYVICGSTLGTFWPVTFGLFVLPLIAWRIVMTVVYARTQSGVVAQLMHFAYTGRLGAFILLAAISPTQDALVDTILAGALWLGVASLAVGGATSRPQVPPAPPGRVDGEWIEMGVVRPALRDGSVERRQVWPTKLRP